MQRRLGVDDHTLAAREFYHEVGTQTSCRARDRFLFGEITIGKHARDFHDAAELDFSPAPANIWSAQGAHQISGLRLQFFLRRDERLNLGFDIAVSLAARDFHLLNLCVDFAQRFANRLHEICHGFVACVEISLGFALKALERFLGDL